MTLTIVIANSNNIDNITFDHRSSDPYNGYNYDGLDRLTEADYLVGLLTQDQVFTMDDLGNRSNVNLTDNADQVYSIDTTSSNLSYTQTPPAACRCHPRTAGIHATPCCNILRSVFVTHMSFSTPIENLGTFRNAFTSMQDNRRYN